MDQILINYFEKLVRMETKRVRTDFHSFVSISVIFATQDFETTNGGHILLGVVWFTGRGFHGSGSGCGSGSGGGSEILMSVFGWTYFSK